MGMNNPQQKNGLVKSDPNEAYSDALLRQVIYDVFEVKTKYSKGNIVSSVINNHDLSSQCIT